nr:maleylpyruvate isomerase N-terminal domain-containing protein [Kineococcus siccus]
MEQTLGGLRDEDLLAASRCRGWTAGDVLAHVHLGLQEMLLGLVSPTTTEPADSDAAAYWRGEAAAGGDAAARTAQVRFVRLLASAYRDPTGLVTHTLPTLGAVRSVVTTLAPGRLAFQGQVLGTGDFLATWACELAVHQLDVGPELDVPAPDPGALRIARATGEALDAARGSALARAADTAAVLALWRHPGG